MVGVRISVNGHSEYLGESMAQEVSIADKSNKTSLVLRFCLAELKGYARPLA